jgi:hypothetical protein
MAARPAAARVSDRQQPPIHQHFRLEWTEISSLSVSILALMDMYR